MDQLGAFKLYVMVAILTIAGIGHFASPQIFLAAMPPYLPYHLELIYFTGALELIFALALLFKKARPITAILLALYFVALLPAHVHVSIYGIEMFGIDSKILLWLRTIFQAVFIFWAYSLRKHRSGF